MLPILVAWITVCQVIDENIQEPVIPYKEKKDQASS